MRALRNKSWWNIEERHFLLSHHLIDSDTELNRVMAKRGVDDDDDVETVSRSARDNVNLYDFN